MFLGHFAVALGTLVFGSQLADLLWPVFLLLGREQVGIVPGITRVTPLDFISYPYSHSQTNPTTGWPTTENAGLPHASAPRHPI